jgi:cytochrome bd-type quinol oxidase subunit 2
MTGIERDAPAPDVTVPEFPPYLDLIGPVIGAVGLLAAALDAGGSPWLAILRTFTGALFLGAVTDAMLLGHWYLVQPGLSREPVKEMVRAVAVLWPFEVVVYLIPIGMVSVLNGSVDDGYGGLMGWMWVVAAVTTIGLVIATWFALKERSYSAVMAATGLMYLAILTGFGMDLLPRALLS